MSKINSLKFSFFLLLFIHSQINCDISEWITFYKGNQTIIQSYKNVDKSKHFAIEFKSEDGNYYDGPNYIKFEVKTKEAPAPLLCFSSSDPLCENRQNLVKNQNGKSVFIWVRKEEYEDDSLEPYFTVICPKEQCSYDIEITGSKIATLKADLVYSYLVTKKSTEMAFQVVNLEDIRFCLCIEGSNTAQIAFKYENVFQNDNVKCVNTKIFTSDSSNNFKITKATEGDYITISIHQYSVTSDELNTELLYGKARENFAIPNGPVVTGFLYSGHTTEECFPLSRETLANSHKLFISGKIYNKYAWFYLENEAGDFIEDTDTEIIDGQLSFVLEDPGEARLLCFEIPTDDRFYQTSVIFSFQIIDYNHINSFYEYTHPQLSGQIYRRMLPKGLISYYYVAKTESGKGKYDYYVNNIKGNAKLYIDECNNFPYCYYDVSNLTSLTNPAPINNHILWHNSNDTSSAIGKKKYLMIVYCDEKDEYDEDYCEFDTSIFYKGQDITILENQIFYKYLFKGENGLILADLKNNRIVERFTFDIIIYSGDVSFVVKDQGTSDESPEIKYYYLSNKIIINAYMPRKRLSKVVLEYKAGANSFFSIRYSLDNLYTEQYEEVLSSGESYLVHISPFTRSRSKTINMKNYYGDKTPFLINFFALNCQFEINNKNITFSDGYAQEYINKGEGFSEEGYYQYNIKIKEENLPHSKDEMCGIYIAGVEIDKDLTRDIFVPINIYQQIIFDDTFKKVRFSVPIINVYKDITYHVNVIDRAHYSLNGYINGKPIEQITDVIIAVTSTYYLYSGQIMTFCNENELCIFSLEVEYKEKIIESTDNPMIEITFREVKNSPVYLQKGLANLDYVCGDQLYYLYTDIGKRDVAEISLNFLREFGHIWAKVVKKDLTEAEVDADWRNLYKLPEPEMENSLTYDTYKKKLIVTTEDTEDCDNGCYLLMTIQVNDIGDYVPNLYYYYLSITAKVIPSHLYYIDIPKTVIQVDEYVIGSLDYAELQGKICSNFYEIWLPHDANKIEFDWQSTHANLYINVGGNRPTPEDCDFVLSSPGRHSLLSLNKDDILKKAKQRDIIKEDEQSIQDINLVIGIWTDKKDSINTELYSLRIHEPELDNKLEIIPVQADQKIMCKPYIQTTIDSKNYYRCYFMILYDYDVAIFNPLLVYGESVNSGANINLYANFIDKEIYDSYNEEALRGNISTSENSQFNTYNSDSKFIYVNNIPWEYPNYLFLTLESDTNDELMIINSIPLYDPSSDNSIIVYPNPFTEQIFSCKGELIKMTFPGNEGLIVSITAINGEAEVKWEDNNDIYYIRSYGERINLLSDKSNRNLVVRNIKSRQYSEDEDNDPGFLFYISYKARTEDLNFDEINTGKTTLISYKNSAMPIILYSKIQDINDDLNIAINFKDNPTETSGDYISYPIHITGSIMSETSIIMAKYQRFADMIPFDFKEGLYYPGTKSGLLYFSKEELAEYNINEADNPSVYIRVEKEMSENSQKNKFDLEAQIMRISNNKDIENTTPLENKYYFANLPKEKEEIIYPLKLIRGKDFVRIQISFNSPNLDFSINEDKSQKQNQDFDYSTNKSYGGKIIYTFKKPSDNLAKIYLRIFKKDSKKNEDFSNNFVFKYMNAKLESDFFDCSMSSSKIKLEKKSDPKEPIFDIIKVTFDQIHTEQGIANITYILKAVDNSNYFPDEEINTIAATVSSPVLMTYERNPMDKEDTITLSAKGQLTNWEYINIIAQIQENDNVEYISYDAITKNEYIPSDDTPSDVTPSDITPSDITPSDVTPSDVTPSDVTPSDNTPSDVTPSDITPSDITPSDITPSDVTPSDNKNNTTLILAITIPIACIILIVIIVFFVLRLRKKKDITKEEIEKLNAYELV